MANPVIKVILSAVDEVSGVAKKASDGISGFAEKAKAALNGLAALGVGAVLGEFFKSTIEEAANAEREVTRLGVALRNAGADVGTVTPQAQALADRLALVAGVSGGDVMEALTGLVTITGDVDGSMKNLSLVMDIAAARGLGLTSAADIVGKAMNGNTTAFNKLGIAGKDATSVLENARASFGGFAEAQGQTLYGTLGRINEGWDQFREQVGNAVVGNDNARESVGKLVGFLGELAHWVEANEEPIARVTDAVIAMGYQVVVAGGALWDSLRPALGVIIVPLKLVLTAVQTVSYGFGLLAQTVKFTAGDILYALGTLIGRGANVLKAFGISVGYDTATSLREAGERMKTESVFGVEKVRGVFIAGMDALWKDRVAGNARIESEHRASGGRITAAAEDELAKRQEAEDKAAKLRLAQERKVHDATLKGLAEANKQLADEMAQRHADTRAAVDRLSDLITGKLGTTTAYALGLTSRAMDELLVTLRGKIPSEEWQALNAAVEKHKRNIADLLPPMDGLKDAAEKAKEANKEITEEQEKQQKSIEKNARQTADLARAFVDAASATGIIDDKMANILNASISLATNIGKAFGGDPTAIAASVTSLANIIVGIGSSETERRRQAAAASNTQALDRLTREVGNLNLRESGKTFAGIQSAVDASIQARADARASGKGPGDADKAAKEAFLKSLANQGIGLEEARALFKELFGRDLALANAGTFFQDIQAFSEGLQNTEFGQFGKDFEGQLDALTRGFEILGITDADDKLQKFRTLVGKFSPALADALNVDLSTPEGIAKATENLRALFSKLESGGLSPTEIGVSGGQFVKLIETILPLLGDANGTLGSGLAASVSLGPVIGASPASTTAAFASSAALLGAPGLPTPSLGPYAGAGLGVAPSGGTVINGYSPSFVFNVSPVDGEDAATFSRRLAADVDSLLVFRLDSLNAAAGKITQVGS